MLSTEEIKRFIDEDAASERKQQAKIGQRYYEAEHDILYSRLFYYNADGNLEEDKTRSNIKISHPFFTELADQLPAYMLSFTENPIRAKEGVEGLQDYLDVYFDDEFWAEVGDLICGCYVKGFDCIYGYKNAEDRLAFQYADSLGVVEVRARDTDDNAEHVIYSYTDRIDKGYKKIKRIQVWDSKQIYFYVQADDGEIELDKGEKINPKPHILYEDENTGEITYDDFGFIPFWRLDYNRNQKSGLLPIKALIDDYDLHACSLSNNLKDFDTPLHVVMGYQGDDLTELQQNLKTKKIVGVDSEGGIDVKTVDVPYQARLAKLELDEKNIYRFGGGLNTAGLKDTNATTNIGIQMLYELLKMRADNTEKKVKRLLNKLLKTVLAEINAKNGTGYQMKDVEIVFKRNPMMNVSENLANEKTEAEIQQIRVNTIMNIAASIGEEKALQALCEVMDWDYEELKGQVEKMQEAQNLVDAQKTLESVAAEGEQPNASASEAEDAVVMQ